MHCQSTCRLVLTKDPDAQKQTRLISRPQIKCHVLNQTGRCFPSHDSTRKERTSMFLLRAPAMDNQLSVSQTREVSSNNRFFQKAQTKKKMHRLSEIHDTMQKHLNHQYSKKTETRNVFKILVATNKYINSKKE